LYHGALSLDKRFVDMSSRIGVVATSKHINENLR